jgi:hypothetical protein
VIARQVSRISLRAAFSAGPSAVRAEAERRMAAEQRQLQDNEVVENRDAA